MKNDDSILISVLAHLDSLFRPVREFGDTFSVVVHEHRRHYEDRGTPVHIGPTTGDRKAGERIRKRLADAGLIDLVRTSARITGVRLAAATEARLRALCGLASQTEARQRMVEIHNTQTVDQFSFEFYDRTWVPESHVVKQNYGAPRINDLLVDLQEDLLPALINGWVISNSSIQGHVSYSITSIGARVIQNDSSLMVNETEETEEASDLYWDYRKHWLSQLRTMKPQNRNCIGIVPLPVSNGVRLLRPEECKQPA